MGREVRRVSKNWEHPKDENGNLKPSKAEHECKFYVNAEWTALSCECGKRIKPKG